jgi:hypothetical protein
MKSATLFSMKPHAPRVDGHTSFTFSLESLDETPR